MKLTAAAHCSLLALRFVGYAATTDKVHSVVYEHGMHFRVQQIYAALDQLQTLSFVSLTWRAELNALTLWRLEALGYDYLKRVSEQSKET